MGILVRGLLAADNMRRFVAKVKPVAGAAQVTIWERTFVMWLDLAGHGCVFKEVF